MMPISLYNIAMRLWVKLIHAQRSVLNRTLPRPHSRRGLRAVSTALLAIVATLTMPVAAIAQREPESLLSGQMELARLVDVAAARLRVNVQYDATVLKGTATLRMEGGVTDEELWLLVNRVLFERGFTTVLTGGVASAGGAATGAAGGVVGAAGAAAREPGAVADGAGAAAEANGARAAPDGAPAEGNDAVLAMPPEEELAAARREPARPSFSVVKLSDAAGLAPVIDLSRVDGAQRSGEPPGGGRGDVASGALVLPSYGWPHAGYHAVLAPVAHRPAKDLVEPLGRIVTRPSGAVSVMSDGMLLIADITPRIEQALALLHRLDSAEAHAVVEESRLHHVSGTQMVALVAQVMAKRDLAGGEKVAGDVIAGVDGRSVLIVAPRGRIAWWRELLSSLDKREGVTMLTYAPRHFPARDVAKLIEESARDPGDDRWRLVIDDFTGTLVLTTTPAAHETVRGLLERLDAAPSAARKPVRSYIIRNRSVRDVRDILEQLINAGMLDVTSDVGEGDSAIDGSFHDESQPRSSANASPSPPGTVAAPRSRLDRPAPESAPGRARPLYGADAPLIITADEGTNTLIIAGESRLLAQIEALLPSLDVRQPQVMLEVLMVTLSESDTLSLGVELEQLQVSGSVRMRFASLFGLSTRGEDGDVGVPAGATGLTGIVLSPGDFSIVLRALENITSGRSLSMPKLLVGNNERASLDSVVQQPFASVNAGNTVSTTSFGGTQDAGTVVAIRPRIAEGDHLVLEYSVSLSSFVGASSSPTLPPPRQQNRVQSVATVPDGHTVVVGGIELDRRSRSTTQVPLLGRVPIIGEAFKSRSLGTDSSRFFVFIRANVLRHRDFEDLKYISAQDVARAGVDDGWPDTEPRIIR